jgi:hypothetical protein
MIWKYTNQILVEFDVENIEPITWPSRDSDPMSTLILDDSDKDVVKALARKYSRGQATWGADFVEGKGEGQIFLLHGKPFHVPVYGQILMAEHRTSWYWQNVYCR